MGGTGYSAAVPGPARSRHAPERAIVPAPHHARTCRSTSTVVLLRRRGRGRPGCGRSGAGRHRSCRRRRPTGRDRVGHRRVGHRRVGHRRVGHRRVGHRRVGHRRVGHRRAGRGRRGGRDPGCRHRGGRGPRRPAPRVARPAAGTSNAGARTTPGFSGSNVTIPSVSSTTPGAPGRRPVLPSPWTTTCTPSGADAAAGSIRRAASRTGRTHVSVSNTPVSVAPSKPFTGWTSTWRAGSECRSTVGRRGRTPPT